MDVRCTSTGKIFFKIDSQIAALLCHALPTVFEQVEQPTVPATIGKPWPAWIVNVNPMTDMPRIVLTKATGEVIEFPGPHEGTLDQGLLAFERAGFPVPANIVEDFERLAAAKKAERIARYNLATSFGIQGG